jgi:hypothetical protein
MTLNKSGVAVGYMGLEAFSDDKPWQVGTWGMISAM